MNHIQLSSKKLNTNKFNYKIKVVVKLFIKIEMIFPNEIF